MVIRLLLVLVVALALGATTASVSAEVANVVVELDGEIAGDLDETQAAVGEVDSAADDHALTHADPEATAPVPALRIRPADPPEPEPPSKPDRPTGPPARPRIVR